MMSKMPFKDSLAIAFIMSYKGVVEMVSYGIARDSKVYISYPKYIYIFKLYNKVSFFFELLRNSINIYKSRVRCIVNNT